MHVCLHIYMHIYTIYTYPSHSTLLSAEQKANRLSSYLIFVYYYLYNDRLYRYIRQKCDGLLVFLPNSQLESIDTTFGENLLSRASMILLGKPEQGIHKFSLKKSHKLMNDFNYYCLKPTIFQFTGGGQVRILKRTVLYLYYSVTRTIG